MTSVTKDFVAKIADLRMGNGTQKEHIDLAKECRELLLSQLPFLLDLDLPKEEI